MRTIRRISSPALAIALALLSIVACSELSAPSAEGAASLVMRFVTPATVRTLVIEVSGPGISPAVVLNVPVGEDNAATAMLTLPAGTSRRIDVSAFDTAGVKTHRADTTVSLAEGDNPAVTMRLLSLTGTLGVTVTFGNVSVTVADTSTRTLVIGESVVIEASGRTETGDSLSGAALTWGGTNPAVISVLDGVVTGVRGGTAEISVSYREASARIPVVVQGPTVPSGPFTLAPNGLTVTCPTAAFGATGTVLGVTYTKRNRAALEALVAAKDFVAVANTCTSGLTDLSALFRNVTDFNTDISRWDVSAVTNMEGLFEGATSFNRSLAAWDVGQLVNANRLFRHARAFNQNISGWDVSAVNSMTGMFDASGGASAFNQDLSGWCVSGIASSPTDFDANASAWTRPRPAWGTCSRASTIQSTVTATPTTLAANGVSTSAITVRLKRASGANLVTSAGPVTFNVPSRGTISDVTDNNNGTYSAVYTAGLDAGAVTLTPRLDGGKKVLPAVTITLLEGGTDFYLAPNGVTVMCPAAAVGGQGVVNGVLYTKRNRAGLDSLISANEFAPLTTTCTSGVENMDGLFYGRAGFNVPIAHWDVSAVVSMREMFFQTGFNQPIADWDVGNVANMGAMFAQSPFNQPIDRWDVSGATNLSSMFGGSTFNQPIGNWDIRNVTNTNSMFAASSFNQPIGGWDFSNVTNTAYMFLNAPAFNQPIGGWNTAKVVTMEGMFYGASVFNQPIGGWNTSKVTNMRDMFLGAVSFNQDIANWNVGAVSNMLGMFLVASSFNQDLSGWCVREIPIAPLAFADRADAWTLPKPVWGTCPTP